MSSVSSFSPEDTTFTCDSYRGSNQHCSFDSIAAVSSSSSSSSLICQRHQHKNDSSLHSLYSLAESSGCDTHSSFRSSSDNGLCTLYRSCPAKSLSDQLLPFEDCDNNDDCRNKPTAIITAYRSSMPQQEQQPPPTRRRTAGLKRTHATVTGLSDLTVPEHEHDGVASSLAAFPRDSCYVRTRSSSWGQFVDVVGILPTSASCEKRRRTHTASRRQPPTEKFVALDIS